MKKIKTSPHIPTRIEVSEVDKNKNRVRIAAYPFEFGYAITIAHPLRRLVLSSTAGFAPTAIKVAGIEHEFDSIRGMNEDISHFIVNLKKIRFKINGDSNKVIVNYKFTGPKIVSGSDLNNDEVSIVSPDIQIATINEDAVLQFSLLIQKGIGYVPSEETRNAAPDGYIPMDAYFTPVVRAVYSIENVLLEDDPNFEKIIFDIETDGQVEPLAAFKNALGTMHKQLGIFSSELNVQISELGGDDDDFPEIKPLLQHIDSLNFSARCFNCLDRANIRQLGELVLLSEDQIKGIKNLGKKSLDEITAKLDELGYPVGRELPADLHAALKKKFGK